MSDFDLDYTYEPVEIGNFYSLEKDATDYEDMVNLNKAIYDARVALIEVTNKINHLEYIESVTKAEYDKKLRNEILKADAKTATERKIKAEIACEDLFDRQFLAGKSKDMYKRIADTLRIELQALQVLSNNVRQQLRG